MSSRISWYAPSARASAAGVEPAREQQPVGEHGGEVAREQRGRVTEPFGVARQPRDPSPAPARNGADDATPRRSVAPSMRSSWISAIVWSSSRAAAARTIGSSADRLVRAARPGAEAPERPPRPGSPRRRTRDAAACHPPARAARSRRRASAPRRRRGRDRSHTRARYAASTLVDGARTDAERPRRRRPGWLPSAEYLAAGLAARHYHGRTSRPARAPIPTHEDSMTRFQKLAVATTVTTLTLIVWGGVVRATGSGDGCPDWPTCFGSWVPAVGVPHADRVRAPGARGGLGAARRRPRRRRRRSSSSAPVAGDRARRRAERSGWRSRSCHSSACRGHSAARS